MSEEARRDAGLMDDYTAAVKKYFLPIVDLSHIRPLDFLDEFGFDLKTFEFGYDLMKGLKEIMSPDQLKRVVDIDYDHYFALQDEEENKALFGMKVLLKDESRWLCAFSPLTFTTVKLEEFVKVAIGFGKIHTCYEWFETRPTIIKEGFSRFPYLLRCLSVFFPC